MSDPIFNFARLMDVSYGCIAHVALPKNVGWPEAIRYNRRVFLQYPVTTPIPDPNPSERVYRELADLYEA